MLKVSDLQQHVTRGKHKKIHTLNSNVLCSEQKQDIACKKLALQCNPSNKKYLQNSINFC